MKFGLNVRATQVAPPGKVKPYPIANVGLVGKVFDIKNALAYFGRASVATVKSLLGLTVGQFMISF